MTKYLMGIAFITLVFTACSKDENEEVKPTIQLPTTYNSTNFNTNAEVQIALRSRMAAIATKAKTVRTAGVSVTKQELMDLFIAGAPSVESLITPYFDAVLTGSNGYFKIIEDASNGGTYVLGAPQGEGGYFEGRVFDENGIEPDEVIDKGMYAAVLYNYATTFMNDNMQHSDVDKIVALFGANPSFPNSGSSNVSQPDVLLANYAARRDKNDGNGLYTDFKKSAIALRSYILAGSAFNENRKTELEKLKNIWEKSSAATVINYCHASIAKFTLTSPTNADIASGLHAYSEGVGFVWGWKTISQQHKIITDAQIDEILVLMNAPAGGTPTSYTFVTDAVNQVPKLQTVISRLQSIYSFSNQEIEDFKKNWVAEQGR
jgi:hypothetical protein